MQKKNDQILFSASDLTYFAECHHRTWLDRLHLEAPMEKASDTEAMKLVQDKGFAHESGFLQRLRDEGREVVEIPDGPLQDKVRLTREAIESGAEVIFQATLQRGNLIGHADFLVRVGALQEGALNVYEVVDTKLSHHTKTKFLVQLCFYSDLLSDITGQLPELIHVELGHGKRDTYRIDDYMDYYRKLLADFLKFVAGFSHSAYTYPEPCNLCDLCHWRDRCDHQRLADDHLSQVANITKSQIVKLKQIGISTMAGLGAANGQSLNVRIQKPTLERLIEQARLQHQEKVTGEQIAVVFDGAERGKGFDRLPVPDEGDLFFDMEGDPMYPEGLEYLFGLYYFDNGQAVFKAFWAHDRKEECIAFSEFMDFVNDRLARYPKAHIYHYAHYENTALKKLMSIHGVHEESVDNLLRQAKMVDLYKVVREGLRISKPSYSIKKVEQFYSEARKVDVTNAADSIVVYEKWRQTKEPQLLKDIYDYNLDDCRSTWELRQWLLSKRPATASWFCKDRVVEAKPKTDKELEKEAQRLAALAEHEAFLETVAKGIESSRFLAQFPESYRTLLLQLVDFHKRADKPAWWALFDRADKEADELFDDMEVIADLRPMSGLEDGKVPRTTKWSFEPQEFKCKVGDQIKLLNIENMPAGKLVEIDEKNCTVQIDSRHIPVEFILERKHLHVSVGVPITTKPLAEAVARYVAEEVEGPSDNHALRQFLLRDLPQVVGLKKGLPLLAIPEGTENGEGSVQAISSVVAGMQKSCLFIQGPPGTGKTYTGSHVIADLVMSGKKVAISSNSHKAINNLLERAAEVLNKRGHGYQAVKVSSKDEQHANGPGIFNFIKKELIDGEPLARAAAPDIVAGTAWLFSSDELIKTFDYLFIDEAGQVATANTVAMGQCADNIVLLGDQMQLGQPIQGDHPGESGLSTLDYLLGHKATIEPERGVFLDRSFRMHTDVCSYISKTFYEGRLRHDSRTEQQRLVLTGELAARFAPTGVYCVPVQHDGNAQRSEEEASEVRSLYDQLLGQHFADEKGRIQPMNPEEILVVAPYNAQVNLLKRELPEGARVGTVDKFQGQEAQVVIVSMTTSNQETMPRQLDFLFSRNRLNVAISRAKSLALVVMSPDLAAVNSDRPDNLALINTFVGLVNGNAN